MTLTAVPGVRVGHWTDPVGLTGLTVVSFPEPNVAAAEVRGAAPGSRETALLEPGMRVEAVQAIVLSGGSAFGLASADGVMRELEGEGRGFPTRFGPVPIVPAAVIYDLGVGDPKARPGAEEGAQAYRSATTDPVEMGAVGAGTGAMVAGWRGLEALRKGGVGSWSVPIDTATVGALCVVNSVGDVFTLEGESLTGGSAAPSLSPGWAPPLGSSTTLVVVATDVLLPRNDLRRVAVRSQDALAACLRPGHTRYDGDAAFVVSCGDRRGDVDAVGEAAFIAVGRAIEAAMREVKQ
ncbi:MAG: P1 family peptidase [Actinomycetota bacterium]|nr:P1 family peptidase [Actinomycetota bacterium]